MKDKIKENSEKIKVNKILLYFVFNVIEVCVCVWEEEEVGGLEIFRDGVYRVECKK